MKTLLKWVGLIVGLLIIVNIASLLIKAKDSLKSEDGKYDVIDGMVGKVAVDKFIEIKEKRDTFNLPAFRTGMMMFQTQYGRFPKDVAELEKSGVVGPNVTRDQYGKPYQMKMLNNNHLILQSSGKDKILGTTDDVQYDVNM